MRSASANFKRLIQERRDLVNYADMTLYNGTVLHLEPKDFRIGGNTYEDDMINSDDFGIGNVIGNLVTLVLDNVDERFDVHQFYNAVFFLYVALPITGSTIEKIRIGKFTIVDATLVGDTIQLEAVDDMHKFDRPYSESNLVYPATLQQIVSEACTHCQVIDNTGHFNRYNLSVSTKPDGRLTYRQVLSYVCQIACVNARMDEYGHLIFRWLSTPSSSSDYYDLSSAKGVTVATDEITITGVRVVNGDEANVLVGTDSYVITLDDNPLTEGIEQNVANYLANILRGLTFRPFSLSYLQDPLIESGDWVKVVDVKGRTYYTFTTNIKFTTGGYTQIDCKAKPPAQRNSVYTSEAAKAIVEQNRNTVQQLSTYDIMVQRMNALAINAMGLYSYEKENNDGSRIYYLSNKAIEDENGTPKFALHSKIWKITGDGFFLCQDGQPYDDGTPTGCVWTNGWDNDGNVVVNSLSAIGINFDWARGGTLTLGGDNNVNGILSVLNRLGRERVHIDNEGLKVGDTIGSKIFITTDGNMEYYYDNGYAGRIYMDAVNYGTQEEPDLRDTFLIQDFNDIGIRSNEEMAEIYMSTERDSESHYDTGYIKLFAHKQTGPQQYQYSELRLDGNGFHIDSAIFTGGGKGYGGEYGHPDIIGTDFKRRTLTFANGICIGYTVDEAELPHVEWHTWPSPDPSVYYVATMLAAGVTQAVFPNLDDDDSIAYEPFIKCASGVAPPHITEMVRTGNSITVTFTAVTAQQVGNPVAPATSECVIKLLRIKG